MSTIEAPAGQGRDQLTERTQHVLGAARSLAGHWLSASEIVQAAELPAETRITRQLATLTARGLIEVRGETRQRRYRVPLTETAGDGWGGGTLIAAAKVAKKKAEPRPVNLNVVRRRILHELVYRRHDAEGLALCLGLDLAVVVEVVDALLEARLICCDGDKYAGMP